MLAVQDLHEVVGIVVVADPAGAEHLSDLFLLAVFQEHLPFFIHQPGFHAQGLLPHGSDGNGQLLVVFTGVIAYFHREGIGEGITGFLVQPARFFDSLFL